VPAPSDRFVQFLQAKCSNDNLTEAGPVSLIVLFHDAGDDGAQERLDTFPVAEGAAAAELAENIWTRADEDAQARPRGAAQRYQVDLFRPGSEGRDAAFGFLIRGRGPVTRIEGPAGDTDAPTERGALGLALRALSEANRQLHVQSESTAGMLAAELVEERRMRKQLETQQRSLILQQNEVLDTRAERELALQREARRGARDDRLFEGIVALVPLLVSEFFRAKGLNVAQTHTRDAAVGTFLSTLTVEQLEKIACVLQPEQTTFFIEMYKQFRAEQVARDAEVTAHKVNVDPPTATE